MPLWKQALLRRYQAPAGDDGSDAGGTGVVDRGDDFVPTDDDADIDPDDPDAQKIPEHRAKPAAAKPEAAKPEAAKPEAKAEAAEDESKTDGKKKPGVIPLDRHKQILDRERELRRELEAKVAASAKGTEVAEINASLTKKEEKVVEMEKAYNKLLADGDLDKASELMSQIRRAEREINEARVEIRMQAATAQATEAARYNVALERIEEAYPALNPDAEEFDAELLNDVADMAAMFQGRGLTPTQALQRAVKRIVGTETRRQENATEVAPRVDEKDVAAERKKLGAARTAEAVRRQPPSTATVGMDSDKAGGALTSKDVMKMSQEDFAKLTPEQLAMMRGDTI